MAFWSKRTIDSAFDIDILTMVCKVLSANERPHLVKEALISHALGSPLLHGNWLVDRTLTLVSKPFHFFILGLWCEGCINLRELHL